MTAWGGRLFSQLALAFQVISEKFPLPGILLDVCLHLISIYKLCGIAVVQIIMALVGVGNQVVVQDKVGEYPAVPVGDKAADHKQGIVTQVELDFVERLQTFVDGNIGIPKFNLACARVKPFDVFLGEEHVLCVTGRAGF